uniref:Actinodin3 n=1 Tax=Nothobranchius furzeri TaxID=105023 RepID=A0A8C6PWG7_NOTFU
MICIPVGLLEATSLVKVKNPGGIYLPISSHRRISSLYIVLDVGQCVVSHCCSTWLQLFEIDQIRMLYQQMRHLELVYGPDTSTYQNAMGLLTSTAGPATTTQSPPPPTTPAPTPDLLENAQKIFLCNPKDPLCKPRIVYLPTAAIPQLFPSCDPRLNPKCRPQTEEEMKAATPPPFPPATPASTKSDPPAPSALTGKGTEYDCDPYWDPDCLIDHPPSVVQKTSPVVSATQKSTYPYFDPYDFKRDLYDPFLYFPSMWI